MKLSGRVTETSRKILALLDDEEWHPQEEIIAETKMIIPPGAALRENERARRSAHGPVTRTKNFDPSPLIESGQRAKVVNAINSMIANSRIEREERASGDRWIRVLRPFERVLIVRDGAKQVDVYCSRTIEAMDVDIAEVYEMSADELGEVERQIHTYPKRFPGVLQVKNHINIARALLREAVNG